MTTNIKLSEKYEKLKSNIASYEKVAVAYSGGVDSTFLLYAAREALGENVIALTASSCLIPGRELEDSKNYCEKLGIKQCLVDMDVFSIDGFSSNPKNRCYICKRHIFETFIKVAEQYDICVITEGSNIDDENDYRPGFKAITELGIKSPLKEAGFSKQDVREMSRILNIPTWDKPSFACLASRIPYMEEINAEKLAMVERAEQLLSDKGFTQYRVRVHGNLARIELLQEDFENLLSEDMRSDIYNAFKTYGFSYVALDLKGYRTGSMNETIDTYI